MRHLRLQQLASLALAACLAACGGDDGGGGGDVPAKHDAGSTKHDAGKATDNSDDSNSDDGSGDNGDDPPEVKKDAGRTTPSNSTPDASSAKADAGSRTDAGASCQKDSDCSAGKTSGTGCCDQPSHTCYVSSSEMCSGSTGTGTKQPPYN